MAIDDKIIRLYEELQRKEKIKIHLKNIEHLIDLKTIEIDNLKVLVEKEEKDIQKLESFNLYKIFKTVLGDFDQQLEKERHEHLQAVIMHKGELENLAALKEERELVKRMISGQFSVKEKLEELLKQKEKIAINKKDPRFVDVFQVSERLASHRSKIFEIKEAIEQGKNTQNTIQKIKNDFEIFDSWHNGIDFKVAGRGKTQMKRIERNIYKANNNIQRFYDELLDLHDHFEVDYENQILTIKDFLKQLIDTMITDWVIKKQLHNSLHLLSNIHDKISLMIEMLQMEIQRTEGYIAIEEAEKVDLMVKAVKK